MSVKIDLYIKKGCIACDIMRDIIKAILNESEVEIELKSHSYTEFQDTVKYPTIIINNIEVIEGTCTKKYLTEIINKYGCA